MTRWDLQINRAGDLLNLDQGGVTLNPLLLNKTLDCAILNNKKAFKARTAAVISHTFASARNSDLTTSIAFRLPVTGRIPKGKRRSDAYQLHAIS